MAQFTITATSATKNRTVTNADTDTRKEYNSPAECADQAAADENATKYAKSLCHEDHEGVWDWVGHATAV